MSDAVAKLCPPKMTLIAGEWISTKNLFSVSNPSTGETIAHVPDCDEADVMRTLDAAESAWPSWRNRTGKERASILRAWFDLIIQHQDELARILTLEQGKPFAEAKGEVAYGAAFVEWFAEEGKRAYGDVIPSHVATSRILVVKQPVGISLAITPWNFPIAMITRKAAAALAAGCPVIVKPAKLTPLCAIALARLAEIAGLPAGLLSIVTTTRTSDIVDQMISDERVRKVSFTGSTETGRTLMARCANQIKKLSLELGGNAPFIVFDDAVIEAAVDGAVASKYRNSGQTCVCTNRMLIQDSVHDKFVDLLIKASSGLKVGDGFQANVVQGPLIDEASVRKVEGLIKDAIEKGATLRLGGKRVSAESTFFEPTVLTNISTEMEIFHTEVFGPVATITRFKTEEEAVKLANATPFGLAAYFFATDLARVWRVAEAVEAGMVGVNTGLISTEVAPFGGIKQSGLGREGSKYGLEEYLEAKYICFGGLG